MNVYETKTIAERLSGNTYPGRGIVLGVTPDGKQAVAAYFIMGRSVNSRNRVFVQEPDGIRTEAHDPSLRKEGQAKVIHLPNEEIHQGKSQEHEGNGADKAREEGNRTINLMEEVGETQRKRVILHLESRGFLLPV